MYSVKKQKTSHDPSSSSAQSSSSSSASELTGTYDVFLSFRGENTRKGFLSHLYKALTDSGIHTFRGEDRLESGESIKEGLSKAIKDSKIAIVVFSENYADSTWCLDELVQIVEAEPKKIVLPVFYYVDPSAIRKQKDVVAEALAKHRNIDDNRMKRWKKALTEAANLKGWDLSKNTNFDGDENVGEAAIRHEGPLEKRHQGPPTYESNSTSHAKDTTSALIADSSGSYFLVT